MGSLMRPSEVAEAIKILETDLPRDIEQGLREAAKSEEGLAAEVLGIILENVDCARREGIPMCQDTGSLIFFLSSGRCSPEHRSAIEEGVRLATQGVPLRANTVEPLTRVNEGSNLGRGSPMVHFELEPALGEDVRLGIMAKGAGSENVGRGFMLEPDLGARGVREAVVETVRMAGAKPCPPVILGVGIGGTADLAHLLSKRALMRPLDIASGELMADALEGEILRSVNELGIGPMGLGGRTTALGVRVEMAHCHTASLPVAVNVGCWALRRVTAEWRGGEFRVVR